jgi:nucleoside-diphosphate kinase
MIEKTLVLIKPDAVQRGLIGEIIVRFEKAGFRIIGMKMVYPDEKTAGLHYADDEAWLKSVGEKTIKAYESKGMKLGRTAIEQGRLIRQQLIDFLRMSPIVALAIEGHNCVAHIRKIVGSTAPADAQPGTIRGDYAFDSYRLADASKRPIQNLIHASDSPENGEREVAIWFMPKELHVWKRIDEGLIYRGLNL